MLSDKYSEFYTDTQIFDEFLYPLCKPGNKEDKKKVNLSTSEIKVPVREQSYNSVSSTSTYNYQPEKVVDSDEEVGGKLLNSILKSKDSATPSKRSSYVVQFNPEVPKPVTSKTRFAFRDEETDSELEGLEVKRGLTNTVTQKVKNIRDMGSSDEEEFVASPKPKQKQPSYLKYTTREAYEAAESSESEVELSRCAPPAVKDNSGYGKKAKKVATPKPSHKRKSKINFGNGNEEDSHFKEDYKEISNSVLVLPPPQDLPIEPPMPPNGPGFVPMQHQYPPPPHHLPHFPYPYPNYYGQVAPAAGPQPPFIPSAPVVPPSEEVVEENASPSVPEEKGPACKKEKIEKISPILNPENQSTPVINSEYDSESEDEPINVYNIQTTTEVDEEKVQPISNATLTLIGHHNKPSPFPHHHHSKIGSLVESDEEIISSSSYLTIKPKHVVYPESIKNAIETLLKMQDDKQRDNLIEKELFEKLKKWYEDTIKDQENSLFLFQKNLDILKGKYAKSRGIKHNQAEDIARKEHEIHVLRDELRKLRHEYDDLLQKLDGQVKINEKQLIEIKKLNEQIKSLQKVNRDQKNCIDKQNAIIDDLEHKIHDQDRHIRDLDSYIKRQEKRILDLNKICSEQERKIEDQGYCVHEQQRKLDAIAATSHPIYVPHHHHHHRSVCPHVKRYVYSSSSSSCSSDDECHYLPKRSSKRVIRSVVVPKKHRSRSKYETIEIVRDSSSSDDEYKRRKPIRIVVDSSSSSSDEDMGRRERTQRTERTVVVESPENYQQNRNNEVEVVERNVKIEKTSTSAPPPPPQTSTEGQKIIKKTVKTTTTANNQSSSSNSVDAVSPKINSAENSQIITTERNVSESSSGKTTEDYYYTDGKTGKTVHVVSSTVTTTQGGDANGKKSIDVEKKGEEYKKIETEKTVKVEVEKKKIEEEKKKAEEEKKKAEAAKKKAEEEKKKTEAAKKKAEEEKKKIEAEKKKAEEEKKKAEAEKKKIEAEKKKLEEESKKTVTTIVETTTNQEQAGSSGQNENSMNNYSNYTETTVETTYEVVRK